jgi:hypothetical protein
MNACELSESSCITCTLFSLGLLCPMLPSLPCIATSTSLTPVISLLVLSTPYLSVCNAAYRFVSSHPHLPAVFVILPSLDLNFALAC